MEIGETTSGGLFVLAWVVGVASLFGSVVETIGMWRFWPSVFRYGILVVDERHNLQPLAGRPTRFETQNGVFCMVSGTECLFRSAYSAFGFRIQTPFPLKGSISWLGGQATVRGRLPVSSSICFGSWLVAWATGATTMASSAEGSAWVALEFFALGSAFVGGIVAFSVLLERKRLRQLVEEFETD